MRFSWDLLQRLHTLSNLLLLIAGDFNDILLLDEKQVEREIASRLTTFAMLFQTLDSFTWALEAQNLLGKGPKRVLIMLEPVLIEIIPASFSQIFPYCNLVNTHASHSNHLALVIHLSQVFLSHLRSRKSDLIDSSHTGSKMMNA